MIPDTGSDKRTGKYVDRNDEGGSFLKKSDAHAAETAKTSLRWRAAAALTRLVIVILLACCLAPIVAAQGQPAPLGRVSGVKLTGDGKPFLAPGATVSIRHLLGGANGGRVSGYGPSFGHEEPRFSAMLPPGHYEIGIQVPDGFAAAFSICDNCAAHRPEGFRQYGDYNAPPVTVDIGSAGHVDIAIIFRPIAAGPPANQLLTCNVSAALSATPPTDTVLVKGSNAWADFGINRFIGGIAVKLDLINPDHPSAPLQIVEARSSGGAAWQSSIGVADDIEKRILHFDQAAGNSAQVWGYAGDDRVSPGEGIIQQDWSPLFSNDYRNAISFTAPTVNTTPCYHSGYRLGDGRAGLTARLLPSGAGRIIELDDSYSVRFRQDETWKWIMGDQGLYMDLAAARAGNLRIYLAGPASGGANIVGPIKAYDDFGDFPRDGLRNLICRSGDCMIASKPIAYTLLIWTVQGRDIAIAIHLADPQKTYLGFVRLRTNLMCVGGGDRCGNLQFHARLVDGNFDPTAPHHFTAGQINTYRVLYDIGTPQELEQRGYRHSASG